jgi:GT2 family glycosyltransferase
VDPAITIGIPTCARPDKIEACLNSIRRHVPLEHRLIVLDSRITDEARRLYESFPITHLIALEAPIGPSESRARIAEQVKTPYLLYLDDDNEVTPGAVSAMFEFMETNPEVDLVAGGWLEYGRYRALGQRFNFGTMGDDRIIYKTYIGVEKLQALGITSLRVDVTLATMLVRREVFDRVTFDPRYGFYYELYDFFLQCYYEQLHVAVLPDVIFEHKPTRYRKTTMRQQSGRDEDKQRFVEKWGLHPVGRIGGFTPSRWTRLKRRTVGILSGQKSSGD